MFTMSEGKCVRSHALRVGMYVSNLGGEVIYLDRVGDTYFITTRSLVDGYTRTVKASRNRMWDISPIRSN